MQYRCSCLTAPTWASGTKTATQYSIAQPSTAVSFASYLASSAFFFIQLFFHFEFICNNNNNNNNNHNINNILKKLKFFRPISFGRDPRVALQKGSLGLLKVGPPEREAPSVKIGTIQRRLAWPLRKDDTQNREDTQLFLLLLLLLIPLHATTIINIMARLFAHHPGQAA